MSRSSPASSPEPERRTGEPEPLVDALGGYVTHRHDHPSGGAAVEETGHHRGPRRHPELRLVGIAVVAAIALLVVLLIL